MTDKHPLLQIRDLNCAVARWPALTLVEGDCVTVAGPSGSGKTRLLRAVADLDANDGDVRLHGRPRETFPGHRWRRRVVYLPAESGWWAETVGEHFAAVDDGLLAELGFDADVTGWSVDRLSTGERSRLALARAAAVRPLVLLLDEPTANLDTGTTERVEAVVARLRQGGLGVIWVTHDPAQVARLGARRFGIQHGEAREVRNDP